MGEIVVTILPTRAETRLLMMHGPDEVMRARLSPITQAHPRWAIPPLLEALARWYGQRLRVVLSADAEDCLYELGLGDGLGLGASSLHYEVEVLAPRQRAPGRRLRGVGDFREARRQLRLGWYR